MYKIPSEDKLRSLIGVSVDQICFGAEDVVINLSKRAFISTVSKALIFNGRVRPSLTNEIVRLIAAEIVDVSASDVIKISFNTGDFIELASTVGYESVTIGLPNGDAIYI